MLVEDRKFVSIDYVLTLDSGEEIDRSEPGQPLGFLCGTGQIIPGLEKHLTGMQSGQKGSAVVEPGEGYGERREEMIDELPMTNFPKDVQLEKGQRFHAHGPHGPISFEVKEIKTDSVVADFNHPLAGERLHFEFTVAEVRDATTEELEEAECEDEGCGGHTCTGCGAH